MSGIVATCSNPSCHSDCGLIVTTHFAPISKSCKLYPALCRFSSFPGPDLDLLLQVLGRGDEGSVGDSTRVLVGPAGPWCTANRLCTPDARHSTCMIFLGLSFFFFPWCFQKFATYRRKYTPCTAARCVCVCVCAHLDLTCASCATKQDRGPGEEALGNTDMR